jgi:polyphenol oxidase
MLHLKTKSTIKYYESDIFNDDELVCAFSTRIGGNTPKPLDSFSLGTAGREEFASYIAQNRQQFCSALGLDHTKIVNPRQVHSANIKIVSSLGEDVSNTDGIITAEKGLAVLLLFADCTPVVIFDEKQKILGVIHAGWRGTAAGISQKAVNILRSEFNSDPENLKAVIGPSICQNCYPVDEKTASELEKSVANPDKSIFVKTDKGIKIDLKKLNELQLIQAGVHADNIDTTAFCTSCSNDIFYSHRKDKGETGRHGVIASIK